MLNDFISSKIRVLSLFAIIAVVFIHANSAEPKLQTPESIISGSANISNFTQYFVANGVARFCIPMFFAISGFLFFLSDKPLTLIDFMRKSGRRVITLMLPFLIWIILGFVLTRLLLYVPFLAASVPHPEVTLFLNTFSDFLLCIPSVSIHLWFLVALFLITLFSYPLYHILKSPLAYPLLLIAAGFWFVGKDPIAIINQDAFLFFSLGGFLAVRRIDLSYNPGKTITFALLFLWLALLIGKTAFSYTYSLRYLHLFIILLGMVVIWFSYDHLTSKKLQQQLAVISNHTFFIYVAHAPFVGIIVDSIMRYSGQSATMGLIAFLLVPPVVIVLLVLIGKGLQYCIPNVYALLSGGRGRQKIT